MTVYEVQTTQVQLILRGRDLAHPVLFLRPQLSSGKWASCDPRSHVETADLQDQSTRVSRGLFKGQTLGPHLSLTAEASSPQGPTVIWSLPLASLP